MKTGDNYFVSKLLRILYTLNCNADCNNEKNTKCTHGEQRRLV